MDINILAFLAPAGIIVSLHFFCGVILWHISGSIMAACDCYWWWRVMVWYFVTDTQGSTTLMLVILVLGFAGINNSFCLEFSVQSHRYVFLLHTFERALSWLSWPMFFGLNDSVACRHVFCPFQTQAPSWYYTWSLQSTSQGWWWDFVPLQHLNHQVHVIEDIFWSPQFVTKHMSSTSGTVMTPIYSWVFHQRCNWWGAGSSYACVSTSSLYNGWDCFVSSFWYTDRINQISTHFTVTIPSALREGNSANPTLCTFSLTFLRLFLKSDISMLIVKIHSGWYNCLQV